jgi:hypothetical protein
LPSNIDHPVSEKGWRSTEISMVHARHVARDRFPAVAIAREGGFDRWLACSGTCALVAV